MSTRQMICIFMTAAPFLIASQWKSTSIPTIPEWYTKIWDHFILDKISATISHSNTSFTRLPRTTQQMDLDTPWLYFCWQNSFPTPQYYKLMLYFWNLFVWLLSVPLCSFWGSQTLDFFSISMRSTDFIL